MLIDRNNIIKFCEDYLRVNDFEDQCVNGLQVEGKERVQKIITGVTLSQKLIKKSLEEKADMILVHHGIFSKHLNTPFQIKGVVKGRIKLLLENDINLAGFHLPLDAHPEIGNNISICKSLGVNKTKPFYVGFVGELDKEIDFNNFVAKVNEKLQTDSFVIAGGPQKIKKVGVVSGGSSTSYELAAELGADAYICGDVRESVVRGVEEIGINLINAGHYNSEKSGIRNLGNLIARKFDIEVKFIDVPCDV